MEKWREKDKEEIRKEATTEEKMRFMKKSKAKERTEKRRRRKQGQPMRMEAVPEYRYAKTTTAKKRKVAITYVEKEVPAKKRKGNKDIKQNITCKRGGEEEDKTK